MLQDRLGGFAAALLDATRPIPPDLIGPDGEPTIKRFAIYRNNVVVGLIDALKANFPALYQVVGEAFFRAMARAYVVVEPPSSPILLDYGAGFPNFIAGFEPAASLPYLPDVARIERAWTESYHASDALPLTAEDFADIADDCAPTARFTPHPSLRVVTSQFPALTIWRMNVGDGIPSPVDLASGGECALLVRPEAGVEVHTVPLGGAEFLSALAERKTLEEASKFAIKINPTFDLAANIAALISAGAFVKICVQTKRV